MTIILIFLHKDNHQKRKWLELLFWDELGQVLLLVNQIR